MLEREAYRVSRVGCSCEVGNHPAALPCHRSQRGLSARPTSGELPWPILTKNYSKNNSHWKKLQLCGGKLGLQRRSDVGDTHTPNWRGLSPLPALPQPPRRRRPCSNVHVVRLPAIPGALTPPVGDSRLWRRLPLPLPPCPHLAVWRRQRRDTHSPSCRRPIFFPFAAAATRLGWRSS